MSYKNSHLIKLASVFQHNVGRLAIRLLTSKYLFVDGPAEWFADQIFEVSHTLSESCVVRTVVGVDHAYEVLLVQVLEVEEQVLLGIEPAHEF